MKQFIIYLTAFLALGNVMVSCKWEQNNASTRNNQDSLRSAFKADSINIAREDSTDNNQLIRTFIKWTINSQPYQQWEFRKKHFTENMVIKLHYLYVQRYSDSEKALAFWTFLGNERNDSGKARIEEINYVGNNWYRYSILRKGIRHTKEIKAFVKNNNIYLDDIRNTNEE